MKYRFVFVVLHYNSIDSTKKCIASITGLQYSQTPGIVIVDNASPNKTGVELEEIYRGRENIKVILQHGNAGFAKGNNAGYLYAKNVMGAECIICANNDVYFVQKDFLLQVDKLLERNLADVFGPDIRTYHEVHQNPLREARLSLAQFQKKHMIKIGWLMYWHIYKRFPFFTLGEKLGEKASQRSISRRNYQAARTDMVLQGACILFARGYIDREDEAFVPDTFMYMEEDILSYKCLLEGYRMRYCPEIHVFHAESVSTAESFSRRADKELFYYRECLRSERILRRYIMRARRAGRQQ